MRNFSIKRKKHFVNSNEPYSITISDALGLRSSKIANGQTLSVPVDNGEVTLKVGALSPLGYAESPALCVAPGGDEVFRIETGYSIYTGANYRIKKN